MKSTDRKQTLLHYLVKVIAEKYKRKKRKGEEAAGLRREEQWDPCSCAVIVPQVGDKTLYRVIA